MITWPIPGLPPALRFLDSCVAWYIDGTFPPAEPPGSPSGWRAVVDLARNNGLGPLMGYMLKSRVPELGYPTERAAESLLRDFKACTIRNIVLMEQVQQRLSLLESHGIGAVVVKGGALLDSVYRDNPGIRPVTDLDIVVADHDFQRAATVFAATGACSRDRRPPFHQLMVWDDPGTVPVDLHGSFFQTRLPLPKAGYRLPEDRFSVHLKQSCRLLPPDRHVFLLVYHALQHSLGRLIWWMDIVLALKSFQDSDLAALDALLDQSSAGTVFSAVLWTMSRRLAVSLPGAWGDHLPSGIALPGRLALARVLRGRYPRQLNLVLYLACAPPGAGKTEFLLSSLLPDGEVLDGTYPGRDRRGQWGLHWQRLRRLMRDWIT